MTWLITELQAAILDEINILEMGSEQQMPRATPTASFHAGAKKSTTVTSTTKGKPPCPFCPGPHIPSLCDSVKDPKRRCEIVCQNRLCFNCLGHHRVFACNSRHRCRNCQRKHHTSLCNSGQDSNSSSQSSHTTSTVQQSNSTPPSQLATAAATNTSNDTTDTASMSMTVPAPQNSVCLLKTPVATVTNGVKLTRLTCSSTKGHRSPLSLKT